LRLQFPQLWDRFVLRIDLFTVRVVYNKFKSKNRLDLQRTLFPPFDPQEEGSRLVATDPCAGSAPEQHGKSLGARGLRVPKRRSGGDAQGPGPVRSKFGAVWGPEQGQELWRARGSRWRCALGGEHIDCTSTAARRWSGVVRRRGWAGAARGGGCAREGCSPPRGSSASSCARQR